MKNVKALLASAAIIAFQASARADFTIATATRFLCMETTGPLRSRCESTTEVGNWMASITFPQPANATSGVNSNVDGGLISYVYNLALGAPGADTCDGKPGIDVTFGVDTCSTVKFSTNRVGAAQQLRVTGGGLDLHLSGTGPGSMATAQLRPGVQYRFLWSPVFHLDDPGQLSASVAAELISECRADLSGDCIVDFADYLVFLSWFDASDPRADVTGDGVVDFSDYLEFLNLYSVGC